MSWLSGLGCIVGLGTIAIIIIRVQLSDTTVRARKALRKLRKS
jgi:hypothetical protein